MSGTERVDWYNGQGLSAGDFQTEQAYFDALLAERNHALHSAGIARGLEVTQGPRDRSLVVSAGLAVDQLGMPILLTDARTIELPAEVETEGYVLITAASESADLSTQSGATGFAREVLDPRIEVSPDGAVQGASHVLLAKVLLDERGAIRELDPRVRVQSGMRAGKASFLFGDHAEDAQPFLRARESGGQSLLEVHANWTESSGAMETAGTLAIGVQSPSAQLDVESARDTLLAITGIGGSFVVTGAGNTGIGVPDPQARLSVAGDILLETQRRLFFEGPGTIQSRSDAHRIELRDAPEPEMSFHEPGEIALRAGGGPAMMLYPGSRATIAGAPEPPLLPPDSQAIPELLAVGGRVRSLSGGFEVGGSTVQNSAGQKGTVRVGTVLDWWRPKGTHFLPPAEYAICDGSTVTDPESPLFGQALPDLRDKFVRGTGDYLSIGDKGGAASHTHAIFEIPRHAHGVAHEHGWVSGLTSGPIGEASAYGINERLAYVTHTHRIDVYVGPTDRVVSEENDGFVANLITEPAENLPAYYALLKIVRIK